MSEPLPYTARLFDIVPVASSRGTETNKGEALRGLVELPWRPFAFRQGRRLAWAAVGPDTLRAAFDHGKTRVSAEYRVDAEGRGLSVFAASRPHLVGTSFVDTDWSATAGDATTSCLFDGLRVPTTAAVSWHLSEGPFVYWRARVTAFRVLR